MQREDLTGRRFNKLTVIKFAYSKNGYVYWECKCDCGNITYVRANNLRSGQVKSCGCLLHAESYNRRHNMSKTRLYRTWASMKNRCCNPNVNAYKDYGGRGIQMCDAWKDKPDDFFDWALSHGYADDLTIERINVNDGYNPDNCTFISKSEQSSNRRSNLQLTHNGKTQNLQQWCGELKLPYKLIHNRIFKLGWDFERAISEDCHTEKRNISRKG